MAEPHIVSAPQGQAHIDATIRLFVPELNPDTIPPKRPIGARALLRQGELSRRVLDTYARRMDGPLARAAIARSIMTDKGFPIDEGVLAAVRNAQWTLATPLL
jgi:hypothetical protein